MKNEIALIVVFLFCSINLTIAQHKGLKVPPTIMVIPFVTESQDLRTILDSSVTTRVAVIKTQEAFDDRGFTTIDFRAKLKATKVDVFFKGLNQKDLKSKLVEASGADVYIEMEAVEQRSDSGNSVRLNLIGYDAFTGRLLGSKTISSNIVFTEKFDKLVENALKKTGNESKTLMLEEFLDVMQDKFDDMVKNGRVIKVIFGLDPNANITFNDEINADGDFLKDVIEDWFEENAYKGNYHSQGTVGTELIYDEVRIPVKDDRGRNFTPNKYARKVRKFCRSIQNGGTGLNAIDDTRGSTIYITIR